MKTILTINPGSTSTKVALYKASDSWEVEEWKTAAVKHDPDQLAAHPEPADQLEFRSLAIEEFLKEAECPNLDAIAGRGGLTRPLEAGSYRIDKVMIDDMLSSRYGSHASNLGALIAEELASRRKIPSLIADPVGVDQFEPLARYSGHPDMPRRCQLHALNMRAVAREAAHEMSGEMEDFRFIIAHLGGGISVSPMKSGRLIDVNHAMDDGPFSPQRSGGLPLIPLVDMCFSGRWKDAGEAKAELTRQSGFLAYLGTDDGKEIERRAVAGEQPWRETYEAMAYQVAKEIGAMATVLEGRVDSIILTGGLPHPPLSDWIIERVGWIAPVRILAGEREMQALARAAARYLFGEDELLIYGEA
ncbi:MAG: butyrate kinase [Spirochaetaceae bacterium]|nr:butyrate kinase [Spirochaetaceae bacterium]